MRDFSGIPTSVLVRMLADAREAVMSKEPSERTWSDYDELYAMSRELDKRKDEPKQVVDVNFSKDYLTD